MTPVGNQTVSTVSSAVLTTTSPVISRIADTQSTYAANVTLSRSGTTTETNTTTSTVSCNLGNSAIMELQVVSDSTGAPVPQQGDTPVVSAEFQTGCNALSHQAHENLYFEKVSKGPSGWFNFPGSPGAYNFTVSYGGYTYSFPGGAYPASTTCVIIAVPSGLVTLSRYQFSNYDCAGDLGSWAARPAYGGCFFGEVYLRVLPDSDGQSSPSSFIQGANVTTYYDLPDVCGSHSVASFTTTKNIEWYAFGDSAKSFFVGYGGQTYNVTASQISGSTCVTLHVPSGAVDFTYGPGCVIGEPSTISSTSTSTTVTIPAPCTSQMDTVLTPAPKGTVYVKVVSNQGAVITNGSLFVGQFGNTTNGAGTNSYCLRLSDVNGTGYVQLAFLNGSTPMFLTSGFYHVTIMAGYNGGSWYVATIPTIQVHPNSTIYVTVSVPSGLVTVVVSNEGSSNEVTTTTSATTIKQNGG
jgi:hypothetical protein